MGCVGLWGVFEEYEGWREEEVMSDDDEELGGRHL